MDPHVKEQIINSVKCIKNKVKRMQEIDEDLELKSRKIFKSIINPLEELASTKSCALVPQVENSSDKNSFITTSEPCDDNIESADFESNTESESSTPTNLKPISSPFSTPIQTILKDDYKNLQVPFGVRNKNNKLMIGNTPITFDSVGNKSMAIIGNKSYEATQGLMELLFHSKPDNKVISMEDKLNYKDILCQTNAHRRDYEPLGQIKGDKSNKYKNIVKPLFSKHELNNVKEGEGCKLPTLKKYNSNIDFIYWDDPNELIDRLKILIASKDAGNTNHDNEIISIIEELKEGGIIKE